MPNHITNELTAPKHVLDAVASEDRAIDFCKIIPRPAIFDCEPSSNAIDWARIAIGEVTIRSLQAPTPDPLAAFKAGDYGAASKRLEQGNIMRMMTEGPFPKDFKPNDFEDFISCIRALKEYGFPSWYEWTNANWGTKWNAYSTERVSDTVIKFQTAWSMPSKVMAALSKKYPLEQFRIRWADEDFGSNVGDITFNEERVISGGVIESGSVEAHSIAMQLLHGGEIPDYMEPLPDGRFGYKEEDAA